MNDKLITIRELVKKGECVQGQRILNSSSSTSTDSLKKLFIGIARLKLSQFKKRRDTIFKLLNDSYYKKSNQVVIRTGGMTVREFLDSAEQRLTPQTAEDISKKEEEAMWSSGT